MFAFFTQKETHEKLRAIIVYCGVLDGCFILVYGRMAVEYFRESAACKSNDDKEWRNTLALVFVISTMVASIGLLIHAGLASNLQWSNNQLRHSVRYAQLLVSWVLIAAILENLAYHDESTDCQNDPEATNEADNVPEGNGAAMWQVMYSMFWLFWIMSCIVVAMMSRRLLTSGVPIVYASFNQPRPQAGPNDSSSPQTIGFPVVGVAETSGGFPPLVQGGVIAPSGTSGYDGQMVAQGMPVQGVAEPHPDSERRDPALKLVD